MTLWPFGIARVNHKFFDDIKILRVDECGPLKTIELALRVYRSILEYNGSGLAL